MEQRDDRENDNDSETFKFLTQRDSFDDFLTRRLKSEVDRACQQNGKPISEERLSPIPSVESVEEGSLSSSNLSETSEITPQNNLHVASVVEEKAVHLEIKQHEIVGSYVSEEVVTHEIDEEAREIYINAFQTGVTELSLEEITKRIHKIDRTCTILRRAQQGYRLSIEEHLKKLNAKGRAEWEKLDQSEREKYLSRKTRVKDKDRTAKVTGKGKGIKSATAFIALGYDKDMVISKLEHLAVYDEGTKAFVQEKFAKA